VVTVHSGPASTVEPAAEGLTVTLQGLRYTVAASCGPAAGHWVCITHAVGFYREVDKEAHIRGGHHTLAWMCHQHTLLETP
jgi:hypothetical protein